MLYVMQFLLLTQLLCASKNQNCTASISSKSKPSYPLNLPAATNTYQPSGPGVAFVTAWSQSYWSCSDFTLKNHSLTTLLVSTLSDHSLTVTNVYGPSDHRHSSDFLRELQDLSSNINGPWVIIGDFNLIRSGDEKNNVNVNIPLMNTFNDTINSLGVMEIPLLGRNFTWSNGQEPPILAKLDRALVNLAHTTTFPDTSLSPRAKPTSDHTPLFLSMSTSIPKSIVFRFENAWLHRQNSYKLSFLRGLKRVYAAMRRVSLQLVSSRLEPRQRFGHGVSGRLAK